MMTGAASREPGVERRCRERSNSTMDNTPASEPSTPLPPSSLVARLTNVFAAPGDVFAEVAASRPQVGNWLVPVLLAALLGVVSSVLIFSQESVVRQVREKQEQVLARKLQKLPKEQREQALRQAEQFLTPTVLKASGAGGAVFGSFFWLFLIAALLWLVARFVFKAGMEFMKMVEVAGLALMVGVLGGLVTMLLIIITGNLHANPGPVLLVREFNPTHKAHAGLSLLNLATFWYLSVLALGFGRVCQTGFLKAAAWVFIPWAVVRGGLLMLGVGGGF